MLFHNDFPAPEDLRQFEPVVALWREDRLTGRFVFLEREIDSNNWRLEVGEEGEALVGGIWACAADGGLGPLRELTGPLASLLDVHQDEAERTRRVWLLALSSTLNAQRVLSVGEPEMRQWLADQAPAGEALRQHRQAWRTQ